MRVVVTGSHGLIGTHLVSGLRERGHDVRRLVRGTPAGPGDYVWNPAADRIDAAALDGADAVVNLAGAGVGDHRWTPAYKRVLWDSRVRSTALLAHTVAASPAPPRVWIQGSAVGYYGDCGAQTLTETSPPGGSFLARLAQSWEAAARPAADAGVRMAYIRTGLVMAPRGGAFGRLLPLLRLGLGGRLGPGTQYWSWITVTDHVAAVCRLLDGDVTGPVNLTAPEPAPLGEIVRALGRALHRPTALPVPAVALKIGLGEFSSEILNSIRVLPTVLTEHGFTFSHPDLAGAAAWLAAAAR